MQEGGWDGVCSRSVFCWFCDGNSRCVPIPLSITLPSPSFSCPHHVPIAVVLLSPSPSCPNPVPTPVPIFVMLPNPLRSCPHCHHSPVPVVLPSVPHCHHVPIPIATILPSPSSSCPCYSPILTTAIPTPLSLCPYHHPAPVPATPLQPLGTCQSHWKEFGPHLQPQVLVALGTSPKIAPAWRPSLPNVLHPRHASRPGHASPREKTFSIMDKGKGSELVTPSGKNRPQIGAEGEARGEGKQ